MLEWIEDKRVPGSNLFVVHDMNLYIDYNIITTEPWPYDRHRHFSSVEPVGKITINGLPDLSPVNHKTTQSITLGPIGTQFITDSRLAYFFR